MSDLVVHGGCDVDGLPRDVVIRDGRIVEVADRAHVTAEATLDATDLVVLPGLIDLQVNGGFGIDLTTEPERLWDLAAALPRLGITAFAPTIITSSPEARTRALAVLAAGPEEGWTGAVPLGWHFEGPMIAPGRHGAHPTQWLVPPSLELVDGWSRADGVLYVTLAPELPGALPVIETLTERGVLVSLGHTAAGSADVLAAVAAGARMATHLGNAMAPLAGREPGVVGVALGGSDLVPGVIVDDHHLDPLFVTAVWRCVGPDRFVTVTDCTAALAEPEGPSRLGDQDVVVADGAVRLADGTLAGSAASLAHCLRRLRAATGCDLADAAATATSTPARMVGDSTRGSLDLGARGDLTLVDADLNPVATVVGGVVTHRS